MMRKKLYREDIYNIKVIAKNNLFLQIGSIIFTLYNIYLATYSTFFLISLITTSAYYVIKILWSLFLFNTEKKLKDILIDDSLLDE